MNFHRSGSIGDERFSSMALGCGVAAAALLFHCFYNGDYGIFRDELGYLACGEHPAWGYVDQPPLVPMFAELSRVVLGDSLRAIRFVPALASSILVVQAVALARLFGAHVFGCLLTAVVVALAPQYLSNGGLLGTNALEPNLWMACAYFAMTAVERNEPRRWLWFGVFAGIGMEEKYTIALFVVGVVCGLLLTRHRGQLTQRWMWIGAIAAFAIFLPNLIWNANHDWPFLQLMHAIREEGRDVELPLGEFFAQQLLVVGIVAAPIWLIGLLTLFGSPRWDTYRFIAIAYVVCFGVLFLAHGKMYYLAPFYPVLFAAGAAWIEDKISILRFCLQLEAATLVLIAGFGIALAPIVVPILSPAAFLSYASHLPFKLPVTEHSHAKAALPQWYADQFGWREVAEAAARSYKMLPIEQRADCAILGLSYGQAGAVDFFGPVLGLPRAISGDRTYYLWGPRAYSGDCVLAIGADPDWLVTMWRDVKLLDTSAPNPFALETEVPVYLCVGKKFEKLSEQWPAFKRWR